MPVLLPLLDEPPAPPLDELPVPSPATTPEEPPGLPPMSDGVPADEHPTSNVNGRAAPKANRETIDDNLPSIDAMSSSLARAR
jgi:hypothetical protein